MVKLLSISGKNSLVDSESIPKSTLQLLFLCSIVGNVVFARKDDKTYESKNYPSPTYRFNEEVETGFENENRNHFKGNSDNRQAESTWNGMKGVYGYRNSDAFRMMDYLGRNYDFNGKSLEPGVSSSNPTDVVLRGKDNNQETKGQSNSKIHIKNLIQNHRLEQEMVEQKPERLTQINGDENVDEEEEEETTEIQTTTTTSTTTTPSPLTEATTKSSTTTTTSPSISTTTTTTTTPVTTTVSSVSQKNNQHREVEGRQSVSMSTPLAMTIPTPSPSPESMESMKQQHKKSLHNKLSVHQLISESMPTLQMSVSPIYFYNKQTRSLVAIPYLIMKSTSKMPLLPGMMDSVSGGGGSGNLINYMNSPFNQKLHSRPINHLSPLLEGFESRSSIDDKLPDLSYSSHHDESESSASSRWLTVAGQSNGQHTNRGLNW